MEERAGGEVRAGIHNEIVSRQKLYRDVTGRNGLAELRDVVSGDLMPGDQMSSDSGDLRQPNHLRTDEMSDEVARHDYVVVDKRQVSDAGTHE